MTKYTIKRKIRGRNARDQVEIWPFNTKEDAQATIKDHNKLRTSQRNQWSDALIEQFYSLQS